MDQNRVKQYMNGGQENLFDKERKMDMTIVDETYAKTNQYGLMEPQHIYLNDDRA